MSHPRNLLPPRPACPFTRQPASWARKHLAPSSRKSKVSNWHLGVDQHSSHLDLLSVLPYLAFPVIFSLCSFFAFSPCPLLVYWVNLPTILRSHTHTHTHTLPRTYTHLVARIVRLQLPRQAGVLLVCHIKQSGPSLCVGKKKERKKGTTRTIPNHRITYA